MDIPDRMLSRMRTLCGIPYPARPGTLSIKRTGAESLIPGTLGRTGFAAEWVC